ncbi:unnamed protein product [Closterium sp. Naga37s-1]|nr:unnamed protein product [Closterium sp. Naga37s-1]
MYRHPLLPFCSLPPFPARFTPLSALFPFFCSHHPSLCSLDALPARLTSPLVLLYSRPFLDEVFDMRKVGTQGGLFETEEPNECGQVLFGQAEAKGVAVNDSPYLPSDSLSPIPPPPPLSHLLHLPYPPFSHRLFLSLPTLPPSFHHSQVNVTRWCLDDLQLKEEESVLRFPLSPLLTPSSPAPSQNMVNVTRWFLDDLQLKEEDSVVVKMDIEGHEWAILQHWLSNPRMAAIVDELFVEVHYHHPSMTVFTWNEATFGHTREETTGLLTDLRKAGFYVHPWP